MVAGHGDIVRKGTLMEPWQKQVFVHLAWLDANPNARLIMGRRGWRWLVINPLWYWEV